MNDTRDHQAAPSQTDPPRKALCRALEHVVAFLRAFFTGSWGLTKDYAPKAWEGFKHVMQVKPRSLVMLSRVRTEGRVKDKAADGELEISNAKAKAIILEAEGKKELRMAKADQLRTEAMAKARLSDAKAKRHDALAARTRQGLKSRKTKLTKVAAQQLSKTTDPSVNGTNGRAAGANKLPKPEA